MADASESSADEAERQLTGMARGRFGSIAPQRIARHVLANASSDEWAMRKAAFDALVRRFGFGRRDKLHIAERPAAGVLGAYATASAERGSRERTRPYQTWLDSLEPLRTSCSCADFVRSSLGLCKHGMAVLEALDREGARPGPGEVSASRAQLRWNHHHPLQGNADRLARLSLASGRDVDGPVAGGDPGWIHGGPDSRALGDPAARLGFIERLLHAIEGGSLAAEPAVSTLLQEERARVERRLALLPLCAAALQTLEGLQRKLYPYQREGVVRFFETGRLLLADDMGLGKTTQAIAAAHGLFETGTIDRALLVVPAALKSQWKREWDATSAVPLTLVDGSPKERTLTYASETRGCLVVSYEQLLRDFAQVQRYAPQLVVLDEAQRIKNWATKSATYVKLLSPAYRLVLTGTPMENRFDELASIMDFVDDLALEPKWRLAPFHCVAAADGGKGLAGARNLGALRERLAGTMLRRVRKEVLAQLPARTDTRVPVEMTEHQRERHDELRQPIAELSARAERRGLQPAEFMQLMQLLTTQRMICNGIAQVQFESEWPRLQNETARPEILAGLFAPKLSVLRALIDQIVIGQRRKAVVFSQWRNMLLLSEWAVRDLLAEAGMRALFFTGAESQKTRQEALARFDADAQASVLFLSDAGGVGLNLQHAASCCINLELPWNPAVLEQRIARIYRLGQQHPIDVYNLVTEEGIETRIATLLAQKQAVFSSLFDGQTNEVSFEGGSSFLEGVRTLVDPLPAGAEPSIDDLPIGLADEATADSEPAAQPRAAVLREPEPVEAPLTVTRLPDGGLRIEASADLATRLPDLLEALARELRA